MRFMPPLAPAILTPTTTTTDETGPTGGGGAWERQDSIGGLFASANRLSKNTESNHCSPEYGPYGGARVVERFTRVGSALLEVEFGGVRTVVFTTRGVKEVALRFMSTNWSETAHGWFDPGPHAETLCSVISCQSSRVNIAAEEPFETLEE